MVEKAAIIWADGPIGTPTEPSKPDIREWGTWVESVINAFTSNGGLIYTSRSILFADLSPGPNTAAWVIGDTTAAYNGIYQKSGGPGAGFWTRIADLPYSFIVAIDVGAGTPSAIQATSAIPISESTPVWMTIFDTNDVSPVTVSFNGATPLTIKTNSGGDPVVGGLVAGMTVAGLKSGTTFRLISDQASAAIQAAAAASATAAASYASLARNDFVGEKFTGDGVRLDFALTADPGTAANVFINVDGGYQLLDSYSLVYVSTVPTIRFQDAPPAPFDATDTPNINIRYGFKVGVNVPANASVGSAQVINNSILTSQLQESGSLFFTTARVLATALAGLATATNAVITAGDTVLTALGKLQKQITDLSTLVDKKNYCIQFTTGAATQADGITGFFGSFLGAQSTVLYRAPIAGTVVGMYAQASAAGAGTRAYTLQNGLADTSVTCSSSAASTQASDTTHTAAVAAGDVLDIKLVTSGGATTASHTVTLVIKPS